jgi:hypothetical protein
MTLDNGSVDEQDDLPPAGERWGRGASSVLPYLTRSLRSKPLDPPEGEDARTRHGAAAHSERTRRFPA